jgi:hypothetical protein
MSDDIKRLHTADQITGFIGDIVAHASSYFNQLQAAGFSRSEAFDLVREMQAERWRTIYEIKPTK